MDPPLWTYGRKVYSQNGEDGIIEYLLSYLSAPTKKAVELGAGDGIECNTGHLVRHHGYTSYLVDGSPYWIEVGKKRYQELSYSGTPIFINSWITRENIIDLLDMHTVPREVDVLSVDIDGNDYWILENIMEQKRLDPSIIVVEYQDIIGPEKALSIPYDPFFNHTHHDCWNGPNYCGASLPAFIHLLKKDYAFVGCEGQGFNGFFVKRTLLSDTLCEMKDITPCFEIEKVKFGMTQRFPRTQHMNWVNILDI
jgi:hypothetical protein